jgi:dihydrofolate synthase/folylpolyglutamate synthase
MDYLGNTREQIGFEKAGIFRPGKAAICSEPDLPVSVRRHAQSIGANLTHIGEHFGYSTAPQSWSYWGNGESRHALPYPALRGARQLKNASACLAALDSLKDTFPVTLSDIRHGLLEVVWPGRFQVLPGRPVTVLDVAHNPGAARAFAASLDRMERYPRTYAVFAMLRDKDIAGVVREVRSRVDVWLVSGIDAPRGATVDEVAAQVAQALQIAEPGAGDASEVAVHTIRKFRNPSEAYAYACEQAARNDRICVFGSFHTVAEVLKNMVERR